MMRLKVPVICAIIGEGASGGALGIGVGDRVVYVCWRTPRYTVISPENCRFDPLAQLGPKRKGGGRIAGLHLTHMYQFGLIDSIIPEPIGGAHWD